MNIVYVFEISEERVARPEMNRDCRLGAAMVGKGDHYC